MGGPSTSNNGVGSNSGQVGVYRFNANAWQQLGQTINGDAAQDRFCTSVALSLNGLIMTSGAFGNDQNGSSSGQVRVFEFNENLNDWEQLGQTLVGEANF